MPRPGSSPLQLTPLPASASPRLIDIPLLTGVISTAGQAERYQHGKTLHTLHVWWARRPHTAMRALAFAALCPSAFTGALHALTSLLADPLPTPTEYRAARGVLLSAGEPRPRVLDMFAGGGTLPVECARLGARASASEANPLAVFNLRCALVYSQTIPPETAARLLQESGERVLHRLEKATEPLFPARASCARPPVAYLWTYSLPCPRCGQAVYLSRRPWLARKPTRKIYLHYPQNGESGAPQIFTVGEPEAAPARKPEKVRCPHCGLAREPGDALLARPDLVAQALPAPAGRGKVYLPGETRALPSCAEIAALEAQALAGLGASLPDQTLQRWSGIVNPPLYGLRAYADLFNPRQRVVLLLLLDLLRQEYAILHAQSGPEAARYILGILSGLVDQLVDWNCRLSTWIAQNEQIGRAFSGPGIPMVWDYAEMDPLQRGPANLWGKLARLQSGAAALGRWPAPVEVQRAMAQALPFPDASFDAILTDPPYYDNLYYSVLADAFYVWKRLLFKTLEPDLFAAPTTQAPGELVASAYRSGSSLQAHEEYCTALGQAVNEAKRVLRPEGVFVFIYSHSSIKGWEALVRAFRPADLVFTGVQPLQVERRQRPRAMTGRAVNASVALVVRKQAGPKPVMPLEELLERQAAVCAVLERELGRVGWQGADIGLCAYAHGVALLANAGAVPGCPSDADALQFLERAVQVHFPAFQLASRGSI